MSFFNDNAVNDNGNFSFKTVMIVKHRRLDNKINEHGYVRLIYFRKRKLHMRSLEYYQILMKIDINVVHL